MKTIFIPFILFFLFLFLSTSNGYSQVEYSDLEILNFKIADLHANSTSYDGASINLDKVGGSPFLQNDFIEGRIIDLEAKTEVVVYLRLNMYNEQVEILKKNNENAAVIKSKNIACQIGNSLFYYFDKSIDIEKEGYFESLVDNPEKATLFLKRNCNFIPEEKAKTPYHQATKASFKTKTDYYIYVDGKMLKVETNTKKFLALFPKNQDKIKTYIKEKSLSPKKENDLIEIIKYYNTL